MQSKKRLLSIICTIAVINLCTVNTTYCWQSLDQSALNIALGEPTEVKPEEPDAPDTPDNPNQPEKPNNPSDSDKPEKEPETSDRPQEKPQDTETQTSQDTTGEADTGDSSHFLFYMALMLLSFTVMIILGVSIIILTINTLENRRN